MEKKRSKGLGVFTLVLIIALIKILFFPPFAYAEESDALKISRDNINYHGYTLEGIAYSADSPLAIINRDVYVPGDVINGIKITKILSETIILLEKEEEVHYEIGDIIVIKEDSGIFSLCKDNSVIEVFQKEKKKLQKQSAIKKQRRKAVTGKSTGYLLYNTSQQGMEKVTLDIYNPGRSGCPIVVLIHGAAGIKGDRAIRYKKFATDLMNKGIIAINVHYFESNQLNWVTTVIQTISYAQTISNADKDKIGLVGYSLGGTIALKVASIDNRLKALAISSGYLPTGFTKDDAINLPKTLIISGSADSSIYTLNKLKRWFKEIGKPIQTKVNAGLGHSVPIKLFWKNWNIIVKFFTNNL